MNAESAPLYPEVFPSPQKKDFAMTPQPSSQNGHHVSTATGPIQLLGPENTVTVCPFCHASIKTAVKYTTTAKTHIAGALWCMVCCLCCVPYSSNSAKNTDHFCPNCQRYLGTYQK